MEINISTMLTLENRSIFRGCDILGKRKTTPQIQLKANTNKHSRLWNKMFHNLFLPVFRQIIFEVSAKRVNLSRCRTLFIIFWRENRDLSRSWMNHLPLRLNILFDYILANLPLCYRQNSHHSKKYALSKIK